MVDILHTLPEAPVDPDLSCTYCTKTGAVANSLIQSSEDGVTSVPVAFCPLCSVLLGIGTLPGCDDPLHTIERARQVALSRLIKEVSSGVVR